ncbi:uncharacterized protein LOC142325702 [Lycorma delicatula]|uniref:uncharacterized protein LOC142325702 n=1 Tax=Lycorma delicatula TaxID=130591 RepID=UPI003F5107E0
MKMNSLLIQVTLIWTCLTLVSPTIQHTGYHYSPSGNVQQPAIAGAGPFPEPGTAPGPLTESVPDGPSAYGPPQAQFPGPYGVGPYTYPPYPIPHLSPYAGHGSGHHLLSLIGKHLPRLIEPVLLAGVGMIIIWLFKTLILPHLGIFAVRVSRVLEDADQSALDSLTNSVRKAITKGICLERLACKMGQQSKEYQISSSLLRFMKLYGGNSQSVMEIFRMAATGEVKTCDQYICWTKTDSQDLNPYKYNENDTNTNIPNDKQK